MKETIVKCYCDYCNEEMSEWEYKSAVRISIGITVPDPGGKAGAYNGLNMTLCDECVKNLGITKHGIHTGEIYPEGRIIKVLKQVKTKILDMFFKKEKIDE